MSLLSCIPRAGQGSPAGQVGRIRASDSVPSVWAREPRLPFVGRAVNPPQDVALGQGLVVDLSVLG